MAANPLFPRLLRVLGGLACLLATPALAQNYYQNGGTVSQTTKTYTTASIDTSAVHVVNSGTLTLASSTLSKTGGASSNTTNSSKFGLNAGVLAGAAGKITLTSCTVSTNASGANGLFATGTGSIISMTGGSISCSAGASHGVDVTYGGTVNLTNVNITNTGTMASAALATDYGGGTVNATGGRMSSYSTGIYSTGAITVSGARVVSRAEGGVIDGSNAITLTNSSLKGTTYGIKCYRTAGGTATTPATVTITGDSLQATTGDAFLVLGAPATINVSGGAVILAGSGQLLTSSTAGTATFHATGETLTGNFVTDATSSLALTLASTSALAGYINTLGTSSALSVSLDASSRWTVTATSYVPTVLDAAGISGTSVTNIIGNGHNVYYNGTLTATAYLGSKTYSLQNGGVLTCPTCSALLATQATTATATIACYPNPATDILHLHSSGLVENWQAFDALGRCQATVAVGADTTLDVSQWPAGVYCLVGSGTTQRVVVMH